MLLTSCGELRRGFIDCTSWRLLRGKIQRILFVVEKHLQLLLLKQGEA